MKERIAGKLKEMRQYIRELESIIPLTLENYKDLKEKAACERYVEKIVEAAVDAGFLVIKYKKIEIPDDDKSAFDILAKEGVISSETSRAIKSAKGMKNIISHQYNKIDDKVVFDSIKKELILDSKNFIQEVQNWLDKL